RPPRPPLFPYTTLFRSHGSGSLGMAQLRVPQIAQHRSDGPAEPHPQGVGVAPDLLGNLCPGEPLSPQIEEQAVLRRKASPDGLRSEEHTSELQSLTNLV